MNELDLFAAAIAISDEGERNALLNRECSGNPALRDRLLNLIEAHFQSHQLLDAPVGEDVAVTASHHAKTETPGTVIAGKYKLLQQIGEGGMGAVWMADQTEPVKRRVAVKLIRVRFVRGELDWIVMKALSKERDRRYESATGLAKDIERFLNNEPVQAGPPSARYRLRKFVQRNRPQVIAAALILFVLLAGIIGTTLGLIEAKHQEGLAVAARVKEADALRREKVRADGEAKERQRADVQKQRAIQFRDQALDALRATTGDDVEKLIGAKKELNENEREYLEAIANRWLTFAKQTGTDEESQFIQAEGHERVGNLWMKLGRRDESRAEYESDIAVMRRLVEQFPQGPKYQYRLATAYSNLGNLLNETGEWEAARFEYQLARGIL